MILPTNIGAQINSEQYGDTWQKAVQTTRALNNKWRRMGIARRWVGQTIKHRLGAKCYVLVEL